MPPLCASTGAAVAHGALWVRAGHDGGMHCCGWVVEWPVGRARLLRVCGVQAHCAFPEDKLASCLGCSSWAKAAC